MTMPERIDLHELADARFGVRRDIAMMIFNAMPRNYFDRCTPEVEGKAEVTLTINGVECPLMKTIESLFACYEEDVKRGAQLIIERNLGDVGDALEEVREALVGLRFRSGVIDCYIVACRGKVAAVIDGWEFEKAKAVIEEDADKHDDEWCIYKQFPNHDRPEIRLVAMWNRSLHVWEPIKLQESVPSQGASLGENS